MFRVAMIAILALTLVAASSSGLFAAQEQANCRAHGDPYVIGFTSFIIPGLGQFLNGQDGKALVHLVVALGLPAVVLYLARLASAADSSRGSILMLAAPIIYLAWGLNSALDAYNVSKNSC